MADKKISQLTALAAANLAPSTDVLAIVDTSATETKKIVAQDLINGVLNVASAVGIGTASPAAKLEAYNSAVNGAFVANTLSTWRVAQIRNDQTGTSGSAAGIAFVGKTDTQPAGIVAINGNTTGGVVSLGFLTVDSNVTTERMRITSDGNLGLGVTPAAGVRFDVRNDSTTTLADMRNANASGYGIYIAAGSSSSQYVQRWADYNNNALATLDASGNLGLGTTSPVSALHIQRGASAAAYYAAAANNATLATSGFLIGQDAAGLSRIYQYGSNPMTFWINDTERGRFTAGGYFKASNDGTYVDSTGTFHELRGGAANGYTAVVSSPVATPSAQYVFDIRFSAATPNDATARFLNCTDATATRAYIRSNGGLSNYQSNNTDLSDARTKNSITPAASMWDKIGALEIVTYKYNDQTHDDVNLGVIAQQVESVEPVWVDADGFGETPEGEEPLKTVYTKDITFAAIKALQEAMARIEQLEADMAALKASA